MTDNKNTILAIALSAIVLLAWQFFYAGPQEKARQQKLQEQQQLTQKQQPVQPNGKAPAPGAAQQPGPAQPPGQGQQSPAAIAANRDAAVNATHRVKIATESLQGTINLKGGRIDDLALVKFRETIDPKSPPIVLLSPSGSPAPFYAEFGWTNAVGATVKLPDADSEWKQVGSGALADGHPVTLSWDNGAGKLGSLYNYQTRH
jgi:YidC/Oxa1 family membrane protein insertase